MLGRLAQTSGPVADGGCAGDDEQDGERQDEGVAEDTTEADFCAVPVFLTQLPLPRGLLEVRGLPARSSR